MTSPETASASLPVGKRVPCAHCGTDLDALRAERAAVGQLGQLGQSARLIYFCDAACRASAARGVARVPSEERPAVAGPVAPEPEPTHEARPARSAPLGSSFGTAVEVAAAPESPRVSPAPRRPRVRRRIAWGPGEIWFVATAALCAAASVTWWRGLPIVALGGLGAASASYIVWALCQPSRPFRRAPLVALSPVLAVAIACFSWVWAGPGVLVLLCTWSVFALVVLMRGVEGAGQDSAPRTFRGAPALIGSAMAAGVSAALGASVELAGAAALLTLVAFGNPVLTRGPGPRASSKAAHRLTPRVASFWVLCLLVPLAILACVALGIVSVLALPAGVVVASGFWLVSQRSAGP